MIAFRKAHPVFHLPMEPKNIDYLVCGHPDVSYHGVKTTVPGVEGFRRQLGILYCGEYGRRADGTSDDYFFSSRNIHRGATNLIFRTCLNVQWTPASTQTTQTITESVRQKAWAAGAAEEFPPVYGSRRGVFWYSRL